MSTKTRECVITELDDETREVINGVLDGEEAILCYENKDVSGPYNSRTDVIVVTKHEIFTLVPRTTDLYYIMYLDDVVSIGARLDGNNQNSAVAVAVRGRGENCLSLRFETKQILYAFTKKLRKLIVEAKKGTSSS